MKIKYFTEGILQNESTEDGFIVMVWWENMSFFKLFGDEIALISPYQDKEFSLPNGKTVWIRISRSKIFDEAREKLCGFPGLTLVDFWVENAKLEIKW